ncbi:fumarylacetoacetase [Thecamonas trahens ATCC 50062]|uniref:Fumarylacetoacetase n=1 Tax=Thecamonas trahens ATCC 50062 TaxID=461836 RepID=A0A0L0DNH6_THETB|nr:fumarylacetoacetase [Thecamonas trahens ATCC 50062]KNC53815.1 fumarylacetoacetase [Thecamonas trahens ATCC 50062]|eukprot:XP_013754371.1 fumarylacetoacetase [Thecamonas trahens ATCC 50062]
MASHDCIVAYEPATCEFPIQNLPYGVFSTASATSPRVGVAIGDKVLDLAALAAKGLFNGPLLADCATDLFNQPSLNAFMATKPEVWAEARARITELLTAGAGALDEATQAEVLVDMADITSHMPVNVPEYIDFYSSRTHATNVGTLIRGAENALQPNWTAMPIGYHVASTSLTVSPAKIVRPWVQTTSPTDPTAFSFKPEPALDFELEMGAFVGGPANAQGVPLRINEAHERLFGLCLFNDWSARAGQKASYVPLGPSIIGKSFISTISPWIVPFAALEPFAVAAEVLDKPLAPHLRDDNHIVYNVDLSVDIITPGSNGEELPITRSNLTYLTWTHAQQLTNLASTGAPILPGTLLATGTISGPNREQNGCMLEISKLGKDPLVLPTGEERKYIADGDVVVMRGVARGDGYQIGFGETRDVVEAALPPSFWGIEE